MSLERRASEARTDDAAAAAALRAAAIKAAAALASAVAIVGERLRPGWLAAVMNADAARKQAFRTAGADLAAAAADARGK